MYGDSTILLTHYGNIVIELFNFVIGETAAFNGTGHWISSLIVTMSFKEHFEICVKGSFDSH